MQNFDKIRNIIFDYGNVIFDIDFVRAQQAFGALGISEISDLYAHHGQDSLFDEFDRGEIDAATFREGIRRLAKRPQLTDEDIDHAWNALLIGVPPGNHEVLSAVKEQYRTFLLSNNNEIHYSWIVDHLQSVHGITNNDEFFEEAYYSHLIGLRKPDPQIFLKVLKAHDLNPDETLFIDDSPQHLRSAEQLGIQTFMISNANDFQSRMREIGLTGI